MMVNDNITIRLSPEECNLIIELLADNVADTANKIANMAKYEENCMEYDSVGGTMQEKIITETEYLMEIERLLCHVIGFKNHCYVVPKF